MESPESEKLFRAAYMQVYSYCMTLCRNERDAEELTADTFFRATRAKDGAAFRKESDVLTWLCAIAKHLFADAKRRESRLAPLPEKLPAGDDLAERVADDDTAFRIHTALHSLEEPYKEVFSLRVFGELSFARIAALFGKTESWARVTYHRAKLQIQERMEKS